MACLDGDSTCTAFCDQGSDCTLLCEVTAGCAIDCREGSSCMIQCTNEDCRANRLLMTCAGTLTDCPGAQAKVCNRPCPP